MKHNLKIGDKVAYKMLDLEKIGIIRSFDSNGTQLVIFFEEEQKEYICQIDQTRKLISVPKPHRPEKTGRPSGLPRLKLSDLLSQEHEDGTKSEEIDTGPAVGAEINHDFIIGDKVRLIDDPNTPPIAGVIIDLSYKPYTLVPNVAEVKWEKPIVIGRSTEWVMIDCLRHFNQD